MKTTNKLWINKPIRLYSIASNSISKKHQYIQATHAVGQYCLDYPDKWDNSYLILLQSNDLETLQKTFKAKGIKYSSFTDSYFGNKISAISACDVDELVEDLELI